MLGEYAAALAALLVWGHYVGQTRSSLRRALLDLAGPRPLPLVRAAAGTASLAGALILASATLLLFAEAVLHLGAPPGCRRPGLFARLNSP